MFIHHTSTSSTLILETVTITMLTTAPTPVIQEITTTPTPVTTAPTPVIQEITTTLTPVIQEITTLTPVIREMTTANIQTSPQTHPQLQLILTLASKPGGGKTPTPSNPLTYLLLQPSMSTSSHGGGRPLPHPPTPNRRLTTFPTTIFLPTNLPNLEFPTNPRPKCQSTRTQHSTSSLLLFPSQKKSASPLKEN
jgi:hypothetical protein